MYTRKPLFATCLAAVFRLGFGCGDLKTKETCTAEPYGCEWFNDIFGCVPSGYNPDPCTGGPGYEDTPVRGKKCKKLSQCTWQKWKIGSTKHKRCVFTDSGCEFWPNRKRCTTLMGCDWVKGKGCRVPGPGLLGDALVDKPTCDNGFTRNVVYINWQYTVDGVNDIGKAIESAIDNCFNVVILSFWVGKWSEDGSSGLHDAAKAFDALPMGQREVVIKYAHDHNAKILLSAGGATDYVGAAILAGNGASYGTSVALLAKGWGIDGVDFDLESYTGGMLPYSYFTGGQFEAFAKAATIAARAVLGEDAIVTHAPQAPFQGVAGYNKPYVNLIVAGLDISWLNIQFYNQAPKGGVPKYSTYEDLFVKNPATEFPGTAVEELVNAGIPAEKIVVGKLIREKYAGNIGYVAPITLNTWACQLKSSDSDIQIGGFMTWLWQSEHALVTYADPADDIPAQTAAEAMAVNQAWGPVVAKKCPGA